MSQHRSLRAVGSAGAKKRNVLKRFERVALLRKDRTRWKRRDDKQKANEKREETSRSHDGVTVLDQTARPSTVNGAQY